MNPWQLSPRTLLGLLATQVVVIAPHVPRLPAWVSLATLLLGLWRGWVKVRRWRLPGRGLLLGMTLLGVMVILASAGRVFDREAGTALLVLMLGLKLLEMRGLRDIMVVICLDYFLIITYFLYSQSILMAVYMFGAVLLITAVLVAIHQPNGGRLDGKSLRLAAMLLLQATPMMFILFVFFPRVPGPLWGVSGGGQSGVSGLSDKLEPGTISQLILSDEVAFRVDFDGLLPRHSQLYWRGPVFSYYNGWAWRPGRPLPGSLPDIEFLGRPVSYTVTLEPHYQRWLFALDLPETVPAFAQRTSDLLLESRKSVYARLRYSLSSYPQYRVETTLSPSARGRALQLPRVGNPRARALARRWRNETQDNAEIVQRALNLFRVEPFRYTLEPARLDNDPIDDFLFNTREGFCEHYASALTFLMRAAGVPARVVTGYQGAEYNALGDYFIIYQANAHAWSEVWLQGRGWVRVDPTAAVLPSRVETGLRAGVPGADLLGAATRRDEGWRGYVALTWDAFKHGWNTWVVGFDKLNQHRFLNHLGLEKTPWQGMVTALLAGLVLVFMAIAMTLLRSPNLAKRDVILATYLRFCTKLARVGLTRHPQEGPADFARRVSQRRPDLSAKVQLITQRYIALRYGRQPRAEWEQPFRYLVRQFRPR
jgi:transglutaminase-like putative cysteine protease